MAVRCCLNYMRPMFKPASLRKLQQQTARCSHTVSANEYPSLINRQLQKKEYKGAYSLIKEMVQRQVPLTDSLCKSLFSSEFDPSVGYAVIDLMKDLHLILPSSASGKVVKIWLQRNGWSTSAANVYKGRCTLCHAPAAKDVLSDTEFSRLKEAFTNKVIADSLQEGEFESFRQFLSEHQACDVVVDGLNIEHDNKNKSQTSRLTEVLQTLHAKRYPPLRVTVIGRQHIQPQWHQIETKFPGVVFYYTQNMAHDDLFFIYAAMLSGSSTYFLTRDKLRNYSSLMGSQFPLMARWQRSRQIIFFYGAHSQSVHLKYPQTHRLAVFGDDYTLHFPYADQRFVTSGAVNEKWICAIRNTVQKFI